VRPGNRGARRAAASGGARRESGQLGALVHPFVDADVDPHRVMADRVSGAAGTGEVTGGGKSPKMRGLMRVRG